MGGKRKYKKNYIPPSGHLNRSQKKHAKEAIMKLLLLGPHDEGGIAEHFGLSKTLVMQLVNELREAGKVVYDQEKGGILRLSNPLQKWWENDP